MHASLFLFGLLIGLKHALEGDHVAAIATLAMGGRSVAGFVRTALWWSLGHALTLFAAGLAMLLLDTLVSQQVAAVLEFAVGVLLLLLGADVVLRLVRERIHIHVHRHQGGPHHIHAHSHAGETGPGPHAHRHARDHDRPVPVGRALAVGAVQGLAGSAALVLLALGSVGSPVAALGYLGLFTLGSLLGMALLSAAVALPLRLGGRHLSRFTTGLRGVVGVTTVVLGVVVMVRTAGALSAAW